MLFTIPWFEPSNWKNPNRQPLTFQTIYLFPFSQIIVNLLEEENKSSMLHEVVRRFKVTIYVDCDWDDIKATLSIATFQMIIIN